MGFCGASWRDEPTTSTSTVWRSTIALQTLSSGREGRAFVVAWMHPNVKAIVGLGVGSDNLQGRRDGRNYNEYSQETKARIS